MNKNYIAIEREAGRGGPAESVGIRRLQTSILSAGSAWCGDSDMNHQSKGRVAEHLAAAALIYNGYQVYHVDFVSGDTDIIAEKDAKLYRCQVKAFYFHECYGKPTRRRREGKQISRPGSRGYGYKKVELRTSNAGDHRSYKDLLTDALIAVDVDTGEVFWYDLTPESPSTSMNKNSIMEKASLIYPPKQ